MKTDTSEEFAEQKKARSSRNHERVVVLQHVWSKHEALGTGMVSGDLFGIVDGQQHEGIVQERFLDTVERLCIFSVTHFVAIQVLVVPFDVYMGSFVAGKDSKHKGMDLAFSDKSCYRWPDL